jgi:hypothetical protein
MNVANSNRRPGLVGNPSGYFFNTLKVEKRVLCSFRSSFDSRYFHVSCYDPSSRGMSLCDDRDRRRWGLFCSVGAVGKIGCAISLLIATLRLSFRVGSSGLACIDSESSRRFRPVPRLHLHSAFPRQSGPGGRAWRGSTSADVRPQWPQK